MRTQVSVKTITEVEQSSSWFLINCFSDMNEDRARALKSFFMKELRLMEEAPDGD